MFSPEEFKSLEGEGKIRQEYGTGKNRDGSEFIDYSKSTYVLVE